MVTNGDDRATMLSDIVRGACELLHASGCALFLRGDGGVALEALAGEMPLPMEDALPVAARVIEHGDAPQAGSPRVLALAVQAAGTAPLGALLVHLPGSGPLMVAERRAAEAFAAFAGMTIGSIARLDTERELVGQLHEIVDSRRQFLTTVSHELRTPLTCIQGFAATLLAHDAELTADERRETLQAVLSHAADLSVLVEQLLEAARVESGRLAVDLAPTDLATAVEAAVVLLAPVLGGRVVRRRLSQVHAMCDPVLLHRVLVNLLSNAAKYSPSDASISVDVTTQGDAAVIDVADEGIGMPEAQLARAFEPFWRASGPQRDRVRGTGIGLALVQEYVTTMGGRVEVASRQGEGSTFRVVLPLADGVAG